jgi:threonine synthase
MKFYSVNNPTHKVSFSQAMHQSIAPDMGLYFPERIPAFPEEMLKNLHSFSDVELAEAALLPFVENELSSDELRKIVEDAFNFPFPLIPVGDVYALELFHGPTWAFKDVGARFMARCLAYFSTEKRERTVLVATSGDTGGAVAHGFLGVEGVRVVILYPKGGVSPLQEKQLTTLGKNIAALEVEGSFDDCQAMVKQAFPDPDLASLGLTSANSINVGRWLPQMIYYFSALRQAQALPNQQVVVSVPSGNFGNICAGILAKKMGLPIAHFIAALNANDTVARWLTTGDFSPGATIATLSNAMDVSNPSNLVRLWELLGHRPNEVKKWMSAFSFNDKSTREALREIFTQGYTADPHGAVGWLGLQEYRKVNREVLGIFLETAHPLKFQGHVEKILEVSLEETKAVRDLKALPMRKSTICTYEELKEFLLSTP